MKQKSSESFKVPKQGIRRTARAVVAAGVLQDRAPKRRELRAVRKIGEAAHKAFTPEQLSETQLNSLGGSV